MCWIQPKEKRGLILNLKNPDSLQVYEVVFYDGYKSDLDETKKTAMEDLVKLGGGEPICVMHRGGQNNFLVVIPQVIHYFCVLMVCINIWAVVIL